MNANKAIKSVLDLPEPIKDWLSSTRLTYINIDMNRRLGINEERGVVIPRAVTELIMGDLSPRNFVGELSRRLNLSPSSAKIIAKEIEEKILHPIEADLKELGIDVGLLHFPEEPEKLRTEEIEKTKSEITPIPILPLEYQREEKPKEAPTSGPVSPEAGRGGPLIIHAEREEVRPPIVPPRPTFSIRIPLNQKKYAPPAPIKARIETGEPDNLKTREMEKQITRKIESATTEEIKDSIKPTLPPLGPLSSISAIKQEDKSPALILPLRKGEESKPDPFVKKVVNYYWGETENLKNRELEN
jgi:hypothetical protein